MWRIIVLLLVTFNCFSQDLYKILEEIKDVSDKEAIVLRMKDLYESLSLKTQLSDEEIVLHATLNDIVSVAVLDSDNCLAIKYSLLSSYGKTKQSDLPHVVTESLNILKKLCAN